MTKYGVIYTERIHIPGDERSRTNPGHGYPAHTVEHQVIKEFEEKRDWEAWINIEMRRSSPKKFRAITFQEHEVRTSVTVVIDEGQTADDGSTE